MSSFLLRRSLPSNAARAFSTTSAVRAGTLARMTIVGRLADQPEVLATSTGGDPIVKYAVGTNSGPRDNQKTSWFKVTAFLPEGPRRDYIANLEKGSLVYVEGDATMSQYTDSEGKSRTSLNIVQQKLEVLARKRAQEEQQ